MRFAAATSRRPRGSTPSWATTGSAPLTAQGLALFDACIAHVLGDFGPPSPYTHLIGHNLRVPMRGHASSAFLRFSFTPESVSTFRKLLLNIQADDGYVAWLNGVEIARRNAPATPLWNSAATAAGDGLAVESVDVSDHVGLLVAGTRNTLAIQGLNVTPGDADFLVLPELIAGTGTLADEEYYSVATPGAPNVESSIGFVPSVTFSAERGYFSTPFSLTLSNSLPGVQIRYTTDGTAPTATTGNVYTGPIPISTTATIRAGAYLSGYNSLRPETRTYLHLPAILQQPASIAGWPQPAISVGIGAGTRIHDYEMDPEITGNPAYQADLAAGMTSIPTVSVVVKKSDMWDSSGNGGFYRSADIERAGSVEYIDPADPTENRQADCGVEGHSHDRMKRSLRLSFKAAYGESKFDSSIFTGSPWGGGMGNRQVDNIVLRAGNNHSFARVWNPTRTTYTEDEWYRATQIAMGGTGSPGRFVHLFINGIYWGLYNAVQRPDADFAAGAMGGSKEDWFSCKPRRTGQRRHHALGLPDHDVAGEEHEPGGELCGAGRIRRPAGFGRLRVMWFLLRPRRLAGEQLVGREPQLAGRAVPVLRLGRRNGLGHRQRVEPDRLGASGVPDFGWRHVSPAPKIWHAARANPDFLMLIADRTFKHLSNGGALSTAEAVGRWDRIAEHVRTAVVAECARWGDVMQEPPSRPDIEWQNEVNRVRNIMLSGNVTGTGTNDNGKVLLEHDEVARLLPGHRSAGIQPGRRCRAGGLQAFDDESECGRHDLLHAGRQRSAAVGRSHRGLGHGVWRAGFDPLHADREGPRPAERGVERDARADLHFRRRGTLADHRDHVQSGSAQRAGSGRGLHRQRGVRVPGDPQHRDAGDRSQRRAFHQRADLHLRPAEPAGRRQRGAGPECRCLRDALRGGRADRRRIPRQSRQQRRAAAPQERRGQHAGRRDL